MDPCCKHQHRHLPCYLTLVNVDMRLHNIILLQDLLGLPMCFKFPVYNTLLLATNNIFNYVPSPSPHVCPKFDMNHIHNNVHHDLYLGSYHHLSILRQYCIFYVRPPQTWKKSNVVFIGLGMLRSSLSKMFSNNIRGHNSVEGEFQIWCLNYPILRLVSVCPWPRGPSIAPDNTLREDPCEPKTMFTCVLDLKTIKDLGFWSLSIIQNR